MREPRGAPGAARERASSRASDADPATLGLRGGMRLRGARRPLRVRPEGLSVELRAPGEIRPPLRAAARQLRDRCSSRPLVDARRSASGDERVIVGAAVPSIRRLAA